MKRYTIEEIEVMLREAGFRVTEHRVAILKAINVSKHPLTVYVLFDILRKKYAIDQATVYRNIASLQEAGLIRRLDLHNGQSYYELETGGVTYQLLCNRCGASEKIDPKLFGSTVKNAIKKSKKYKSFSPTSIEVRGVCKSCS